MSDSNSPHIPVLIERADGEIINAIHIKPKDGTVTTPVLVIMLHGFPKNQRDGNNLYGLLADHYADIGFPSLQFDYINCESNNAHTQDFTLSSAAKDMKTVHEWAKKEGYTHLAFVAEGLGAPILYANLPKETRFSVLFWPAFDLKNIKDSKFCADQHDAQIEEHGYLMYQDLKVGQAMLEELDSYDLIKDLHNAHAPTLILQGEKDSVFTPEHLEIARKHLMAPRIDITSFDDGEYGLGKSNHRKACLELIRDFSQRHTSHLPTAETQGDEKDEESA